MISFAGMEDRFNSEMTTSARLQKGSINLKLNEKTTQETADDANLHSDRGHLVTNGLDNYKKFATMDEKKYRSITGKEIKKYNPVAIRPESGRSYSQADLPKFSYMKNPSLI